MTGPTPMADAWLQLQAMTETFSGFTAREIAEMPFDEYSRLRQRAGLAPVEVPVTPAPAPQAPEPHFTETVTSPEPVGLDPDSPEYFRAWRSQRVSGGERVGIFDSASRQAQLDGTRAHAGRGALSSGNVTPAPALTGRQERQGDMLDYRTVAERFGVPGNSNTF